MKPPRRLGKGLAALVNLHGGAAGTASGEEDGGDSDGLILQLLSTTVAQDAPAVPPSGDPVVDEPAAAEPRAPEPAAEVLAAEEPAPAPEPVPEPPTAPSEPAAPSVLVEQVAEPEPAFVDEWFDAPVVAFAPAPGAPPAAPRPAPASASAPAPRAPVVPQAPRPAAPRTVLPPTVRPAAALAPAPPAPPDPESVSEREPRTVLLDDDVLIDDFVVGSFLPDVDLDS